MNNYLISQLTFGVIMFTPIKNGIRTSKIVNNVITTYYFDIISVVEQIKSFKYEISSPCKNRTAGFSYFC